jgi:hypothetical protein
VIGIPDNKLRKAEALILSFCIFWGYFMIALGAWHCYPNAEEYELAVGPRDSGVFRFMLNLLEQYDGRYSTNLFHAINPLTIDWINGYRWLPIFAVTSFVFSLAFFLNSVLKSKSKWQLLLISLFISLCFFCTIPSLVCSLYWAGGSFVYLYPCTFLLLFGGVLHQYLNALSVARQRLFFMLSCITLVIGIGFNEMFLPVYALLLSVGLFYVWLMEKRWFHRVFPIVILGFFSLVFFVASPGVSSRIGDSDKSISPILFSNNLKNLLLTLFNEFTNPVIIFALLYCSILFCEKRFILRANLSYRKGVIIGLGVFLLAYCMCVAYYLPKQSMFGYPERIYAPIVFLFVIAQFLILPTVIANWFNRFSTYSGLPYIRIVLLSIVLLFLIKGNNNISGLYNDFRCGRMTSFKMFMEDRIARLKHVATGNMAYKFVIVPQLGNGYPTSIYTYPDVENDRKNSIWNKYHEAYFRLDEIAVEGDSALRFQNEVK